MSYVRGERVVLINVVNALSNIAGNDYLLTFVHFLKDFGFPSNASI